MAVALITKNTFLDVASSYEEVTPTEKRRSSSLPPSFKPVREESHIVAPKCRPCWADLSADDDASTDCDLLTEYEYDYERSPAGYEVPSGGVSSADSDGTTSETGRVTPEPEGQKVVTLHLCDTIEHEKPRLTKLSAKARLFEPSMPRDMRTVLTLVHAFLCNHPKILSAQMSEAKLGGTTTIVASYAQGSLPAFGHFKILEMLKKEVLDAAAKSENTYVLGYMAQPFAAFGNNGFSGKLGTVAPAHNNTTCWDTYKKGFCPRRSICRWCHPGETDVMNLVVMLNEVNPNMYMGC